METFLYLTTTGRRSGLPRRIEIWFVELEGRFCLVSERRERSGWVRNIGSEPNVRFSVGTREDDGQARPLADARARIVGDGPPAPAVKALMDDKYGWSDGLVVELDPS